MHPLLKSPLTGTRLPTLVVDGRGAGEPAPRSHAVPSPGARWTLVVLDPELLGELDEHATMLAAEAVDAIVVEASARAADAPVTALVDSMGVVQHTADSVELALDAIRGFRVGDLLPIPFAASLPAVRCRGEGRRRRAVQRAHRRAA